MRNFFYYVFHIPLILFCSKAMTEGSDLVVDSVQNTGGNNYG